MNDQSSKIIRQVNEINQVIQQAIFAKWKLNFVIRKAEDTFTTLEAVNVAKVLIRQTHDRKRSFPQFYHLLGDPSWLMMLEMYIAHHSSKNISITWAIISSGVPQTTGIRYVRNFERAGVLSRLPDPFDKRRVHIQVSKEVLIAMTQYLIAFRDDLHASAPIQIIATPDTAS